MTRPTGEDEMSNETEWVLVPREPSEAMLSAAHYELADKPFSNNAERSARAYAAMLSAAPQPDTGNPVSPPAEAQPVAWQFQDREGKWHGFTDERHRQNTIADGSWPVRALYAAPPSAPVGVEAGWYRYNKPTPRWEDTKFGKWLDPAVYGPPREQHGYSLEVASLAQQPAAVDRSWDELEIIVKGYLDDPHADAEYVLRKIAVLAAQQGGES